jgi:hypothetical protein
MSSHLHQVSPSGLFSSSFPTKRFVLFICSVRFVFRWCTVRILAATGYPDWDLSVSPDHDRFLINPYPFTIHDRLSIYFVAIWPLQLKETFCSEILDRKTDMSMRTVTIEKHSSVRACLLFCISILAVHWMAWLLFATLG